MSGAAPGRALRRERRADWLRLEALLDRLERRSARSLSDEELLAIPVLYRSALSSLSVARATVLDAALVEYLEALSTRAYLVVYGARLSPASRIGTFFAEDWRGRQTPRMGFKGELRRGRDSGRGRTSIASGGNLPRDEPDSAPVDRARSSGRAFGSDRGRRGDPDRSPERGSADG